MVNKIIVFFVIFALIVWWKVNGWLGIALIIIGALISVILNLQELGKEKC